jgi:hypothetical protein
MQVSSHLVDLLSPREGVRRTSLTKRETQSTGASVEHRLCSIDGNCAFAEARDRVGRHFSPALEAIGYFEQEMPTSANPLHRPVARRARTARPA